MADEVRVLLGDDIPQGFCLAYDLASKCFGEYSDFGEWSSFGASFDLATYLHGDTGEFVPDSR